MTISEKLSRAKSDYDAVYEAAYNEGAKTARKAIWDSLLNKGKRVNFNFAFYCPDESEPIWNDDTFDPPYDIVPEQANRMFRGFGVTDMPALLTKIGRVLDFSKCTSMPYVFSDAISLKKYGTIVVNKNCGNLLSTFANCPNLETIEEIYLPADCGTKWENTFKGDTSLKNIRFTGEGYIQNDIDFSSCPLSKDSIVSVLNALVSKGSGKTVIFNKKAKEAAFDDETWETLLTGYGISWTIALK